MNHCTWILQTCVHESSAVCPLVVLKTEEQVLILLFLIPSFPKPVMVLVFLASPGLQLPACHFCTTPFLFSQAWQEHFNSGRIGCSSSRGAPTLLPSRLLVSIAPLAITNGWHQQKWEVSTVHCHWKMVVGTWDALFLYSSLKNKGWILFFSHLWMC